jgi:hypothetical protein
MVSAGADRSRPAPRAGQRASRRPKAPDDPFVIEALAETARLLEALAGLSLGQVRYFDLPASADVVKDAAAVRALRAAHATDAGVHGLSVPIFVIKDISFGFKGLAGAIPGVPGLVGRPSSGVVVEKQGQGKRMGRLLAHELGSLSRPLAYHRARRRGPRPLRRHPRVCRWHQGRRLSRPPEPDVSLVSRPPRSARALTAAGRRAARQPHRLSAELPRGLRRRGGARGGALVAWLRPAAPRPS